MKKSILTVSLLVVIFTILLTGCTTPKYHKTDSPILQTDEYADIEIQCLYLDREMILKRHGIKHNPFLPPQMSFTPKTAIIFEIKIKNNDSAPMKLDIRDVQFYFNDMDFRAMSKTQMEDQIDEFSTNGMDKIKKGRTAKAYMLGDIKIIEGNSEAKGYLVFMSGFKDRGDAELVLPFKGISGDDITDFSFHYSFGMKKNR